MSFIYINAQERATLADELQKEIKRLEQELKNVAWCFQDNATEVVYRKHKIQVLARVWQEVMAVAYKTETEFCLASFEHPLMLWANQQRANRIALNNAAAIEKASKEVSELKKQVENLTYVVNELNRFAAHRHQPRDTGAALEAIAEQLLEIKDQLDD